MKELKYLISFSDKEIGVLQFYFKNYIIEKEILNINDVYDLAVAGTNLQYMFRFIKDCENKQISFNKQIKDYLKVFENYSDLFLYLKENHLKFLNDLSGDIKYNYINQSYSTILNYSNGDIEKFEYNFEQYLILNN